MIFVTHPVGEIVHMYFRNENFSEKAREFTTIQVLCREVTSESNPLQSITELKIIRDKLTEIQLL